MASKLRSPDGSSLLYAVFRKQKHLAGVGDVRAEENIQRADRQLQRFDAYLADLGGEEEAEMEEL